MFAISKPVVLGILSTSTKIQTALKESPMWVLLGNEPVVTEWIAALDQLQQEVDQSEAEEATTT